LLGTSEKFIRNDGRFSFSSPGNALTDYLYTIPRKGTGETWLQ